MKREILDRYARTQEGSVIIDINAGKVEDLYNDYDRYAPYIKKELDAELVEYIIDSVDEIGSEPFVIRFHLITPVTPELASRLSGSIAGYFHYLRELELRAFKQLIRKSLYLLMIGLLFITASVWLNSHFEETMGVLQQVFAEGLTIVGWVSLWEAVALFLIDWMPHRRRIRMYERIAHSGLDFTATP